MGRERQALTAADIDTLDWEKGGGLIPAIAQDADTLQVLMLAWVSRESLAESFRTGQAVFHSRSRQSLWRKGETSGNTLTLKAIHPDCDQDTLLMLVSPAGPACHLETTSCFSNDDAPGLGRLARLARTVKSRKTASPDESYTASLLAEGPIRAAQKLGEEGVETALAGAAEDLPHLHEEAADLLYHLVVLLESRDTSLNAVLKVLEDRARQGT